MLLLTHQPMTRESIHVEVDRRVSLAHGSIIIRGQQLFSRREECAEKSRAITECSYFRHIGTYRSLNIDLKRIEQAIKFENLRRFPFGLSERQIEEKHLTLLSLLSLERSKLYSAPCKICFVCTSRRKSWPVNLTL
jgi:hypothetical protein